MADQTLALDDSKTLFGHPIGLFILFLTEMWERFSYYGMRAILTLYMITSVADKNPGLGWDEAFALSIYGWYTMLVYLMCIPGGILADKFIGQKNSVMLGGFILVAGHLILAVDAEWAFFTGLALIILGVGALKPNISTMVGGLYGDKDIRRDSGFYIFYIGINVGAFLAAILVGFIGETYGWHYGFGLAGIGMILGQAVFIWGRKYLKGVGEPPVEDHKVGDEHTKSLSELIQDLMKSPTQLAITILLAILSIGLSYYKFGGGEAIAYSLLGIFLSLVVGLLTMIYKDINSIEKDRFVVLILSFLIIIVFWGAFEQAGGLMNIYTLNKIDRFVSAGVIDFLFVGSAVFMLIKGIISWRKNQDSKYVFFPISIILIAAWLFLKYYKDIPNPYEIPTSVFQSVNALFIMIFATLIASFWIWWQRKGYENSSLFKMAVGTIIMGIGFLFMAKASWDITQYGEKSALYLLILAYLFHTIGELCASPVALSFITKLAPVKYVSILMGVYFAATGLGNKVAGGIGEAAQSEPIRVEVVQDAYITNQIPIDKDGNKVSEFTIVSQMERSGDDIILKDENGKNLSEYTILSKESEERIFNTYNSIIDDIDHKPSAIIDVKVKDGEYVGNIEIFEEQDNREFWTFITIFGFTFLFGMLLILFINKLKKLSHGAEDIEVDAVH